jgi:hypothetical protein
LPKLVPWKSSIFTLPEVQSDLQSTSAKPTPKENSKPERFQ